MLRWVWLLVLDQVLGSSFQDSVDLHEQEIDILVAQDAIVGTCGLEVRTDQFEELRVLLLFHMLSGSSVAVARSYGLLFLNVFLEVLIKPLYQVTMERCFVQSFGCNLSEPRHDVLTLFDGAVFEGHLIF